MLEERKPRIRDEHGPLEHAHALARRERVELEADASDLASPKAPRELSESAGARGIDDALPMAIQIKLRDDPDVG